MKRLSSIKKLFNYNRKNLYIILSIVILSVLTLTVVYAALSTTLNINGNAEVIASNWDIYLDNVQLNNNSASKNLPTITTPNTASFTSELTTPGDFYEFTIDVVNNGTIDAMIDSVTKTPELTDTQKKYLKYTVEYQNGEAITTKQLVAKNSFVRLKVKLEFRKDISASDLPTTSETLNLSFKVNYIQSDDSSENIFIDNNGKLIKIVSGNYDTVGSEICIGEECFYVISSDEESVTMLAKYNLHVGNKVEDISYTTYALNNPTEIQNSAAIGAKTDSSGSFGKFPWYGTTTFSSTNYWSSTVSGYDEYVYDNNSNLYNYVENYKIYLESYGTVVEEARLIEYEELKTLGCGHSSNWCYDAPKWVYGFSYWTGSSMSDSDIRYVRSDGFFGATNYSCSFGYGVRPVITILKSEF